MEPKWELKSIKNRKNTGKKVSQKKHEFRTSPVANLLIHGAPQTHTIQQDNLQIDYTEQQKEDNLQQITYRRSSKGNVHDRLCARLESTAVSKPNTPRAPSGPVRISVAYGNIPAPGLGKLERASQESLRIVCGCLAELVAVKENLTNLKKIVKNRRGEQK